MLALQRHARHGAVLIRERVVTRKYDLAGGEGVRLTPAELRVFGTAMLALAAEIERDSAAACALPRRPLGPRPPASGVARAIRDSGQ